MCSREGCGAFWGIIVVCTLVFSFAFPWYFNAVELKTQGGDQSSCTVLLLRGWSQLYCVSKGGEFCDKACDVIGSSSNWRDTCGTTGDQSCDNLKHVYDVTAGLLGVSLLAAVLVAIGLLVRCCSTRSKEKRTWHVVLSVLGIVFLGIAAGYFAGKFDSAMRDDYGAMCDASGSTPGFIQCSSFFGSSDKTYTDQGLEVISVWGGAGWVVAVAAIPMFLIVWCLSCSGSSRSYNDSYVASDEGISYVAYQPQPSYQPQGQYYQMPYAGQSTTY